jgi:hypothetical protein
MEILEFAQANIIEPLCRTGMLSLLFFPEAPTAFQYFTYHFDIKFKVTSNWNKQANFMSSNSTPAALQSLFHVLLAYVCSIYYGRHVVCVSRGSILHDFRRGTP